MKIISEKFLLLFASGFLFGSAALHGATFTLAPVADTYVRDGATASSNFGSSTTLQTKNGTSGYSRMTYLQFDISSVTGSTSSARLRLYGKASETSSISPTHAYAVSDDAWTETGMTWNNKPATLGSSLSNVNVTSTSGAWYEWDVTSFVVSEQNASHNKVSLVLKHDLGCVPNNDFNSKEASVNKPQLVMITDAATGNNPPSVSITSPANGATFRAPAAIGIQASATDSDGTIVKVEFLSGSTLLSSDTSSPYATTWNSVGVGSYSLTARATDNASASTTSSAVNVIVNSSSSSSSSAPGTGTFKVTGGKIYDPAGKEFIVKGVNIQGMNSCWGGDPSLDLDKIKNCWKFNAVRIYFKMYPGSCSVNGSLSYLHKQIDAFTAQKVVVIVEGHDRTGSYHEGTALTDLINFYKNLATKYKGNTYVWYDIANEPGGTSSTSNKTKYLTQYQEVTKVIRDTVGSDNIIMVEGHFWGQDAGTWDSNNVPTTNSAILSWGNELINFNNKTYQNIVFSIHLYDQWRFSSTRMADYFDRVKAKGYALVIGEYGVENGGKDCTDSVRHMFQTAVSRKIGRMAWHWYGGDGNTLTTGGNGNKINSCTSPTNLTWLGQQAWNDNHRTDGF